MTTHQDLARDTVRDLVGWLPDAYSSAVLEHAEVVTVGAMGDLGPGFIMLWEQVTTDQGRRKFGMLRSIREMVDMYGGDAPESHQMWMPDLLLAIEESHQAGDATTRTWFQTMP